jgi:hypothetical protein
VCSIALVGGRIGVRRFIGVRGLGGVAGLIGVRGLGDVAGLIGACSIPLERTERGQHESGDQHEGRTPMPLLAP